MTRPNRGLSSDVEADTTLGHLVDELTRKIRAGQHIDLQALLTAHPGHAEELRELVPALQALAGIASSLSRETPSRPAAGRDERVGSGVVGDYRILREIGRGGMGVVYEAEQRSLNRRVALKILPLAAALDARQFQRFQLEAQAAACLHHQNIVPVFAVGTEGSVPYYAMQYIEGRSLAEVIRELRRAEGLEAVGSGPDGGASLRLPDLTVTTPARSLVSDQAAGRADFAPGSPTAAEPLPRTAPTPLGSSPPPEEDRGHGRSVQGSSTPLATRSATSTRTRAYARTIAGLGLQAAEALDHAHTRGILHRDIKPGNLLLDPEGRLWVADFGLAQIQGSHGLTLSGDVVGTLRYMSPEQALGKRVVIDGRTDIYSLGVTLYELLTLHSAYEGKERAAVLRQIADQELPRFRQFNPAVPTDLETIIRKTTAKDPIDRYATAKDLADDLRRFLEDKPIEAVRPSRWVRARKWMQRHREATLAIFVVVATAVILAGGWAWDLSRRRIQLSQDVGRMLGAARASLQSDDTDAALRYLSEARGHLIQAGSRQGPLVRELDQLSGEAAAQVEAEERYHRFQDLRGRVHSLMYNLGGEQQASALEQCRTALQLYQVLDSTPWEPPQPFRDLPPVLQAAARDGVHELLFLLARMEVKATHNLADRARGHRRAIDVLRRLEAMVGPWPATSMWMAQSWEAVGEKELAGQAIQRTKGLAAETALNDFMIGEYKSQERKVDDALSHYTRALRRRPNHFLSLLGMAGALYQLRRYEAAEAMLTGAIALSPDTAIAYYHRASSRQSQGKFDLALEDLNRMSELNPQDYLAYYSQAFLLQRRGNTAEALAMFDKALELNPRSFSSHLNRGSAYARLGQFEKARADFTVVIDRLTPAMDLLPRNRNWVDHLESARIGRASASASMGRRDEALEDFKKALEFDPNSARVYHCRAVMVWMPAGQMREAVEDLSQAIKLEPNNPNHARHRSECFVRLGELDRALADLSRVVELRPEQPAGYLDRGIVLVRQGRYQDAVADAERALGLPAKVLTKFDFYNAACLYALASARVAGDQGAPGRIAVASRYADRAVELLRQAVASGWAGPHDLEHLRKDPDLDPIHDHPGFRDILKSAERAGASGEGQGRADHPASPHEH